MRIDAPTIGVLPSGPLDSIADVAGVTVGHCTMADGALQTGVTIVRPTPDDAGALFRAPLPAGVAVINGFGKSLGLLQLAELGALESCIALTNTFAVGTVATALTQAAVRAEPRIGRELASFNALVMECNDGALNDMQAFALQPAHVQQAFDDARTGFAQGSVGAGRGMSCFGLKGGIGSASRIAATAAGRFTLGALVLANCGRLPALRIAGRHLGPLLAERLAAAAAAVDAADAGPERGSIIIVLASDAPLDARQLTRVARRAAAGLARCGSDYGHGSGDIALAFSTQRPAAAPGSRGTRLLQTLLHEPLLDALFAAAAEATEAAIVNALFAATDVVGRDGTRRVALPTLAPDWRALLAPIPS